MQDIYLTKKIVTLIIYAIMRFKQIQQTLARYKNRIINSGDITIMSDNTTCIETKQVKGETVVYVNGDVYATRDQSVNIYVTGDVESLRTTSGDVIITGSVDTCSSTSGDISTLRNIAHASTVSGDIIGNHITSASTVSGDVVISNDK